MCIYHWISILLNITKHDNIRYWYSRTDNWARIESVILERMLLRNFYFSRCKVDPPKRIETTTQGRFLSLYDWNDVFFILGMRAFIKCYVQWTQIFDISGVKLFLKFHDSIERRMRKSRFMSTCDFIIEMCCNGISSITKKPISDTTSGSKKCDELDCLSKFSFHFRIKEIWESLVKRCEM